MSQLYFENDGYEYQPSESSERGQPTPNKPNRPTAGNTQESLVYSASSQDTNRISQSVASPQFVSKGPHILINNNEQSEIQQSYMTRLKNQHQAPHVQIQNLQQHSPHPQQSIQVPSPLNTSNMNKPLQSPMNKPLQQQQGNQNLPRVVQVINSTKKSRISPEPTPVKSVQTLEDLEQQLIQEKLNSEQLRIYNHIIKLELEKKLYNQGKKNENAIDLYLEIQHNRVQMATMQNEYKQKDQIIQHLENSIKQSNQISELMKKHENELQSQNDEQTRSIQEAMENINVANSTINQLEQEKDALIDYVEQQKHQNDQLKDSLQKLQQNYQELSKELQGAQDQIMKLNQINLKQQQIESELQQKQSEIQEAENMRKQLQKAISDKQKDIMQYQLQLTENTNKLIEQEHLNKEMNKQLNESMQQISYLKRQNEEQQSQIHILNENIDQINYDYESNASKTGRQVLETDRVLFEKELLIKRQQTELEQIIEQNQVMQKDFQELLKVHQQLGALQEKHQSYQHHTEQLNKELNQKSKELNKLAEQLQQSGQQVQEYKHAHQTIQVERQQILEEMESQQQKFYEQEMLVKNLSFENQSLLAQIKEIQNLEIKFGSLEIKYQAEIEYYEKTIQELQARNENIDYTTPSVFDERRLSELQRMFEKLDRILFLLTNNISNQKPSNNIDEIIQQLAQTTSHVEQCFGKQRLDPHKVTDRLGSRQQSMDQLNKVSTNRDADMINQSKESSLHIRQIQPFQQTVAKRRYFL